MFQMIVINLICCVLFPIFVFWNAKIYENNTWNIKSLTKDDTGGIRGIAAFFVLFAHLLIELFDTGIGELGPAVLYKWCGGLGVCVFFFVSGYGLWISYDNKKIDASFIKKRLNGILPTYFLIRLISIVLLKKYELGFRYTLLYFFSIKESAWFVVELLIIYYLFYFVKRYGGKNAILYMFILLTVMSVAFIVLNFEARWYNANLIFCLGMVFAKYRNKYIDMVTKREKRFLLITIIIGVLFCVNAIAFTAFKGYIWANIFKLLAGGLFSLCLVNLTLKVSIRSKGLLYVGKYSLHIYLLHMIVIEWFENNTNYEVNLLALFVTELIVSVLVFIGYCWCEDKVKNYFIKNS